MYARFARTLSQLRHEKGVSQREAAQALEVSQALLSHYENGVREPGLAFVVKACNYYNVSADFLLGRTLSRDGTTIAAEELYDYSTENPAYDLHGLSFTDIIPPDLFHSFRHSGHPLDRVAFPCFCFI